MNKWFSIQNQADVSQPVEIKIYDQIGKDWLTGDGIAAKDFAEALSAIPKEQPITVAINSGGGNIWDGLAIANLLIPRNVTTRNDGIAASISALIFMAGKKRIANDASLTMIHRAWSGAVGNAADMTKMADDLKKHDEVIAAFIASRTGKTVEEVFAKMEAETWFSGKDAVEYGIADELLTAPNIQNSISAEVIAKFKNAPAAIKNLSPAPVETVAATELTVTPEPTEPSLAAPVVEEKVEPQIEILTNQITENNSIKSKNMENKDNQEMFAIAKRLNKIDAYEKAISNGVTLADFRAEILSGISAPVIEVVTPKFATAGESFVNDAGYKNAVKNGVRQFNMEVPLDFRNATGTSSGLTSIEKLPGIVTLDQRALAIGDLIPQTATDSTTIRYIQESSFTNAATGVAEEGSKPEASWALAEVDATVRKIAVVGRVTDEMFADYGQMKAYVDNRLRYMVQAKEDTDLMNGSGTAPAIRGLLNFSGIQTQVATGFTVLDAIHKAITKVRATGNTEPDAVVMHPTDYQLIRLLKDSNGNYIGGNSNFAGGDKFVWGLPVVTTTAIAAGTALVGAYRYGSQIFRKMGLTVESTNSDASDFQFNRIAIRVETRLALACYRPLAFCSVTSIT